MANLELGPGYAEIALLAARDLRLEFAGMFLYVEAEENVVSTSLFKDIGNSIIYRHGSDELANKIMDVWDAEEPHKRWTMMQMIILADTFEATFGYDEMFDEADPLFDHREVAIRARFGDKPVDYTDP